MMDSNFGWSEEGLQLLAKFKNMIEEYGGAEELAHKIEVEIIRTGGTIKRPSNTQAESVYTYQGWRNKELQEAIRMRRDGYSYRAIGNKLGRSRNSVSTKFDYLRKTGQLTDIGEWVD